MSKGPESDPADVLVTAGTSAECQDDLSWFVGPTDEPDRYELVGNGLRGGEGTTWKARYRGSLTQPLPVAVKQLRPPDGADTDWPSGADLRRWNDQRQVLATAHVPHVVAVRELFLGPAPHRAGEEAGPTVPYVVMDWVGGRTLADEVSGEPAGARSLPLRLTHLADVASAIAALQSPTRTLGNPMLHRDIKPANCVLDPRQGVVLVDINTMREIGSGPDHAGLHSVRYAAPEVVADPTAPRRPPSDVYSLGALGVFLVLGADPPDATTSPGCRAEVRRVVQAAGLDAADRFCDVLLAALATEPSDRPTDVNRWVGELRELAGAGTVTPQRRRRRRAAAAAGAIALVGVAALAYGLQRPVGLAAAKTGHVGASTVATTAPTAPSSAGSTGASAGPGSPAPPSGGAVVPRVPGTGDSPASGETPTGTPAGSRAPSAPTQPPPGGGRPPAPSGSVVSPRGSITSPTSGSAVPSCAYLSGTARLPLGKRLILGMTNLSNGDGTVYLENTTWSSTVTSGSWRGAQYFGSGDSSAGQRYRVTLLMVDAADAERFGNDYPPSAGVPPYGTPLASVDLDRVAGQGPGEGLCPLS